MFPHWICFSYPISTHDLTRRSTHTQMIITFLMDYFNSRPHEEVDSCSTFPDSISSLFQLTTSRGGRQLSSSHTTSVVYFNSRPHEEVDEVRGGAEWTSGIFQLTTSRGGRQQFHTTLRHLKLSFLCLYYIFEHFLLY